MTWLLVIVIIPAVVFGVTTHIVCNNRLKAFFDRPHALQMWHDAFPQSTEAEIHAYLEVIAECYGINRDRCLKLRPDDKVNDLYQAIYPPKWSYADGCETEYFIESLENNYTVEVEELWSEGITFGDIYTLTAVGQDVYSSD